MVLMEKNLASERRRYPRFFVDLPIKYTRTKLYSRYGKYGRVVNASEGGLLAHLPEETEIGQQLALQLFFSSRSELDILRDIRPGGLDEYSCEERFRVGLSDRVKFYGRFSRRI